MLLALRQPVALQVKERASLHLSICSNFVAFGVDSNFGHSRIVLEVCFLDFATPPYRFRLFLETISSDGTCTPHSV